MQSAPAFSPFNSFNAEHPSGPYSTSALHSTPNVGILGKAYADLAPGLHPCYSEGSVLQPSPPERVRLPLSTSYATNYSDGYVGILDAGCGDYSPVGHEAAPPSPVGRLIAPSPQGVYVNPSSEGSLGPAWASAPPAGLGSMNYLSAVPASRSGLPGSQGCLGSQSHRAGGNPFGTSAYPAAGGPFGTSHAAAGVPSPSGSRPLAHERVVPGSTTLAPASGSLSVYQQPSAARPAPSAGRLRHPRSYGTIERDAMPPSALLGSRREYGEQKSVSFVQPPASQPLSSTATLHTEEPPHMSSHASMPSSACRSAQWPQQAPVADDTQMFPPQTMDMVFDDEGTMEAAGDPFGGSGDPFFDAPAQTRAGHEQVSPASPAHERAPAANRRAQEPAREAYEAAELERAWQEQREADFNHRLATLERFAGNLAVRPDRPEDDDGPSWRWGMRDYCEKYVGEQIGDYYIDKGKIAYREAFLEKLQQEEHVPFIYWLAGMEPHKVGHKKTAIEHNSWRDLVQFAQVSGDDMHPGSPWEEPPPRRSVA